MGKENCAGIRVTVVETVFEWPQIASKGWTLRIHTGSCLPNPAVSYYGIQVCLDKHDWNGHRKYRLGIQRRENPLWPWHPTQASGKTPVTGQMSVSALQVRFWIIHMHRSGICEKCWGLDFFPKGGIFRRSLKPKLAAKIGITPGTADVDQISDTHQQSSKG